MKVLYICSPVEKWNFKEDTTPMMIAEAASRGKSTFYTTPDKLLSRNDLIFAEFSKIEMTGEKPFYRLSEKTIDNIKFFDVIHIRTDPPFDLEYYYTTILLEMVTEDVLVINSPKALRSLNEKLSILKFPQFITETSVVYNADSALKFISSIGGRAVAKNLQECSSKGIVLLEGNEGLICREIEKLFSSWSRPILFQKYLHQVVHGETRITLIDGKAAGYMKKIPARGSFLDGHLSEINVTSPGLLKHTNEVMGVKLEAVLEDVIDEMIKKSNK